MGTILYKNSRQLLAYFCRLLSWTPVTYFLSDDFRPSELFGKFQRQETYFQLKVILAGIVGFAAIFGVSFLGSGGNLPWDVLVQYYSLAVAVAHALLVMLTLIEPYLYRLVIFRRPWILALVSYLVLIPLLSKITFTTGGLFTERSYILSSTLLLFILTLYCQQSFLTSACAWLMVLTSRASYLVRRFTAAEVSKNCIIILNNPVILLPHRLQRLFSC